MIVSRCIACHREYGQNAPAFCGCGSSAFTTIHEAEAPTTSPEGRALRGELLSSPEALALGMVSVTSADSASAPEPGAADESADEPDTIGGADCSVCGADATHAVDSLEGERFICDEHAEPLRAAGVYPRKLS